MAERRPHSLPVPSHDIVAPDFPWAYISGTFALAGFWAKLIADELVSWLEGLVPCRSCQSLGGYLRQLLKQSIPHTLKVIDNYEMYGFTGPAKCAKCGCGRARTDILTPQAPPRATCRLTHEQDWAFDILRPSTEALQWIKDRLRERYHEEAVESAWSEYVDRQNNKVWASLNRPFVPWATFPGSLNVPGWSSNENTFGPAFRGRDDGIVIKLRRVPKSLWPASIGQLSLWVSYLNRPSHAGLIMKRGPCLTSAVGAMVLEPKFGDTAASNVFDSYNSCDVELAPATDWPKVSFSPPSKLNSGTIRLEAIQGVTLLFPACRVLHEARACEKLLQMRLSGAVILQDLIERKFTGVAETEVSACLSHVVRSAMNRDTLWGFPALCTRLSLLFTTWNLRPKNERLHECRFIDLRHLYHDLFSLVETTLAGRDYRLFAPDTAEGWEDTAETTALGAICGSVVATVTLRCLRKIEELQAHDTRPQYLEERSQNTLSILSAILRPSATMPMPEKTVPLSSKGQDIMMGLHRFLLDVKRTMLSITHSYKNQIDGERLGSAFQQAYTCVIVARDLPLDRGITSQFFGLRASSDNDGYDNLREGNVLHYDARFAIEIFFDISCLATYKYTEDDLKTDPRFAHYWKLPAKPWEGGKTPMVSSPSRQSPSASEPSALLLQTVHRTQAIAGRKPLNMTEWAEQSTLSHWSATPITTAPIVETEGYVVPGACFTEDLTGVAQLRQSDSTGDSATTSSYTYTEGRGAGWIQSEQVSAPSGPAVYVQDVPGLWSGSGERLQRKDREGDIQSQSPTLESSKSIEKGGQAPAGGRQFLRKTQDRFWSRYTAASIAAIALLLLLGGLIQRMLSSSPLPDLYLPLPAARLRYPFSSRSGTHPQGSVVCIIDSPANDWYRILDIDGRIIVSSSQKRANGRICPRTALR